jgi:hypothetical protein
VCVFNGLHRENFAFHALVKDKNAGDLECEDIFRKFLTCNAV